MLCAQLTTGELITLALLTTEEIKKYRNSKQFYCPVCQAPVMIKAGKKMIPHFAHYSKTMCLSYKGGEGVYHEKGKLLLYQWLKSQHLDVQLEPYLRSIKQQPDLLLTLHRKKIAIEFQCARTEIRQIKQRNEGYIKAGIIPIWILGANRLKRSGKDHLQIDQFTKQFIHQFSKDVSQRLFYFCPTTLQLLVFHDIFFTHSVQAIGKMTFNKLNQITFLELFKGEPFAAKDLYERWKKEKEKFRTNYRKQSYGQERAWRQWLYLKQSHIEYLPSIIYFPVANQYQMKTSPWNWQSRLCLDIIDPLAIGESFTMNRCYYLLRKHLPHENYFPLTQSTDHSIDQYLLLLEQLNIIHKQTPETFIKVNNLTFYNHIEQALTGDEQLLNEMISKNIIKIRA